MKVHPLTNSFRLGWQRLVLVTASLLFSLIIGGLGLGQQVEAEIELDAYIERYLKISPVLSQSQIQKNQRQIDKSISEQRWTSQLSLQPQVSRSSIAVSPGSYEDRTRDSQIFFDVNQNLPSGTLFGVRSGYSWRNSDRESETNPTESLAFYLQQNLWQNFGGRQGDLQEQIAASRLQRSKLELEGTLLTECITATRLFLDLYSRQQMRALYQESARDAEDIFNRYRKLFQQRLIRETELLTAESDLLANRKRLVDEQLRYEQSLISFLAPVDQINFPANLRNPEGKFTGLDLEAMEPETLQASLAVKRLDLEIEESQTRLALTREQVRSRIDLVFEIGRGKSQQIVEFGLLTSQREYVQLGLNASIPIVNKVPAFEVERAKSDVMLGQERRRASIRAAELEAERIQMRWKFIQQRTILTQQRSRVLDAKLRSARQQVDRLQMELFDYIRHRSELINSRLEEFENQRDFWNQRLDAWLLLDITPKFCRVAA